METPTSFRVADYMKTNVISLPPTATMQEAIALMIEKHTNGLVVIDENQKVAGILSSWDIIQYIVPDYLEADKHLASFEAGDVFAKRITELKDRPISDFMSKQVHTCQAEHALMEAATMLSEYRIRQLPVVNAEGTLVGYINRTDIKRAMGDVLGLNS